MKSIQEKTDKITTVISSVMLAAMMIILFANVVLRYIPGIGGFKWYMEGSQYLNVWAMLIIGIQITVKHTHLKVEVLDSLVANSRIGQIIVKIFNSLMILLFYIMVGYSGYLLASKAKQAVSTMPKFTMGQVYFMIPIACFISAIAVVVDLIASLQDLSGKSNESASEEGGAEA